MSMAADGSVKRKHRNLFFCTFHALSFFAGAVFGSVNAEQAYRQPVPSLPPFGVCELCSSSSMIQAIDQHDIDNSIRADGVSNAAGTAGWCAGYRPGAAFVLR